LDSAHVVKAEHAGAAHTAHSAADRSEFSVNHQSSASREMERISLVQRKM